MRQDGFNDQVTITAPKVQSPNRESVKCIALCTLLASGGQIQRMRNGQEGAHHLHCNCLKECTFVNAISAGPVHCVDLGLGVAATEEGIRKEGRRLRMVCGSQARREGSWTRLDWEVTSGR